MKAASTDWNLKSTTIIYLRWPFRNANNFERLRFSGWVGGRFNSPTHGRPPYSFILSRGPTTIITITTCIRLLHNQQKQNKTSKSSPPLFLWSLRLQPAAATGLLLLSSDENPNKFLFKRHPWQKRRQQTRFLFQRIETWS